MVYVGLCSAESWRWHFERLSDFMKISPSFSANPELHDITIRFVMYAEELRCLNVNPYLPFVQTLDGRLVAAVNRSSFNYIAVEHSTVDREHSAAFADFVQSAFPVLSQKGMLRISVYDPPFDPLSN